MRVVSMSTSRRTQLHGQWKTIRGCGDGDWKSRLMRNEKEITEESSELHILQSMLLEKSDETNLIASFGESAWSFITLLSKPEMAFPLWINYTLACFKIPSVNNPKLWTWTRCFKPCLICYLETLLKCPSLSLPASI